MDLTNGELGGTGTELEHSKRKNQMRRNRHVSSFPVFFGVPRRTQGRTHVRPYVPRSSTALYDRRTHGYNSLSRRQPYAVCNLSTQRRRDNDGYYRDGRRRTRISANGFLSDRTISRGSTGDDGKRGDEGRGV